MFTRMIESQRVRERGVGARAVSVAVHATILGAAAYATARAAPAAAASTIFTPLPVYVSPARATDPGPVRPVACRDPRCLRIPTSPVIDVQIPDTPLGPPIDGTEGDPGFGNGLGTGLPTGLGNGDGDGDGGAVYEIVERPAVAQAGNPRPAYPGLLRAARIEGTVSARFVVDTTGRVEPASLTFESAGERLFEASVRRALSASRFSPAESQGHRVRMLVRQDFAFRLTP